MNREPNYYSKHIAFSAIPALIDSTKNCSSGCRYKSTAKQACILLSGSWHPMQMTDVHQGTSNTKDLWRVTVCEIPQHAGGLWPRGLAWPRKKRYLGGTRTKLPRQKISRHGAGWGSALGQQWGGEWGKVRQGSAQNWTRASLWALVPIARAVGVGVGGQW